MNDVSVLWCQCFHSTPSCFHAVFCIFISLSPTSFEDINNFKCVWCIKDIWKSLSLALAVHDAAHLCIFPRYGCLPSKSFPTTMTFWKSLFATLACLHLVWTSEVCNTWRKPSISILVHFNGKHAFEICDFCSWTTFVFEPITWALNLKWLQIW